MYPPMTQLFAETRLADQRRQQQEANETAWAMAGIERPSPAARPAPNALWRSRQRLGAAMIRLGGLIAGPACPPLTGGTPYPRA